MQAWLKAFSAGRSSALSTVKYRNPSGEGGPAGLSSPGCEEHHPVLSLSIVLPSELAAALQHSLTSSSRAAGVCWKKLWLVDAPRQATHYSRFPPLSPHLQEGGGGAHTPAHMHTSPLNSRWPLSAPQIKAGRVNSSSSWLGVGGREALEPYIQYVFKESMSCACGGRVNVAVRKTCGWLRQTKVAGVTVPVTSGVRGALWGRGSIWQMPCMRERC